MDEISLFVAKRLLSYVWHTGRRSPGLHLDQIVQINNDVYKDYDKACWGLVHFDHGSATVSLITGVIVADARQKTAGERDDQPFFFRLAMAVSIFYMLICFVTIVMGSSGDRLEVMNRSHLLAQLLQGIVGSSGFFFVLDSQKPGHSKTSPASGSARAQENLPNVPRSTFAENLA